MNKCEKYFWDKLKIKDTLFGCRFLFHQTFKQLFSETLIKPINKLFKNKIFTVKQHHYRVMNFIGITK